eukprot:2565966-Lingulodinium_polyedra.AAC.1
MWYVVSPSIDLPAIDGHGHIAAMDVGLPKLGEPDVGSVALPADLPAVGGHNDTASMDFGLPSVGSPEDLPA